MPICDVNAGLRTRLLPAPVGHEVLAGGGELLLLSAIGEHGPDLGFAADGALEDDVAVIG